MTISVIGAGYVGLVTDGCLAEIGHEVVCADNDPTKLGILEAGGLPIYEPGLDKVISKARKEGRLRFSGNPANVVAGGGCYFHVRGAQLLGEGARVDVYDPRPWTGRAYEAVQGSEALLIAIEWNEFRTLDWERVHHAMSDMRMRGFEYHCFGRAD